MFFGFCSLENNFGIWMMCCGVVVLLGKAGPSAPLVCLSIIALFVIIFTEDEFIPYGVMINGPLVDF